MEQAGVSPFFAVDTRALTAANLEAVRLLVILRDGASWPGGAAKLKVWMTWEQENAVVNFVERGGGFLALHNATALYPEGGTYLRLVGGTYTTHGPLERFRVNVLDRSHVITHDVNDFEVADEQHIPIPDRSNVHLLLESRSAEGVVGAAGWAYQFGAVGSATWPTATRMKRLNTPNFKSCCATPRPGAWRKTRRTRLLRKSQNDGAVPARSVELVPGRRLIGANPARADLGDGVILSAHG